MKEIVITSYQVPEKDSNIFRLQTDAAKIVRQLQRQSGLSASYILSEIIRQVKDSVSFKYEGMIV